MFGEDADQGGLGEDADQGGLGEDADQGGLGEDTDTTQGPLAWSQPNTGVSQPHVVR